MTDTTEPIKVGECYKLTLHSQNGVLTNDGSFRFNVNMKDIEGQVLRCGVKKVRFPPPATYTSRRLWFADGNTWKNTFTDPQGKVNDYNTLFAKYGLNNFVYVYYPFRNMYLRWYWTITENAQIRQTVFSTSVDGVNWTANGNLAPLGLLLGVDWSGTGSVPFDCYEIDITTLPVGTNIQNIHCPQLKASSSFDTTTKTNTDIIGNVCTCENSNPYVVNDLTFAIHNTDCNNEVSGGALRSMRTMDIYFSRVDTPTVKETVVMPWYLEIIFNTVS